MNAHDERHEVALAELLSGDASVAHASAQELAADCHECAEQLDGLTSITAALAGMQRERDEILALAALAPKSSRTEVLAAAARAGVPLRPMIRARIVRRVGAAIAIAAMITFAFLLGRREPGMVRTPVTPAVDTGFAEVLGTNGDPVGIAPRGDVSTYGSFTWSYERESNETFTLLIYDASSPDSQPVRKVADIATTTYRLSATQAAALPKAIEWVVRVKDSSGKIHESQRAEAKRGAH